LGFGLTPPGSGCLFGLRLHLGLRSLEPLPGPLLSSRSARHGTLGGHLGRLELRLEPLAGLDALLSSSGARLCTLRGGLGRLQLTLEVLGCLSSSSTRLCTLLGGLGRLRLTLEALGCLAPSLFALLCPLQGSS